MICNNAPVRGTSLYVVVEEMKHNVHLFHPFTLTELTVTVEEYRSGVGLAYWPVNETGKNFSVQRVADKIQLLIQDYALRKKTYPSGTSLRVLAELRRQPLEEVDAMVKAALPAEVLNQQQQTKLGRSFRLAKGVFPTQFQGRERVLLQIVDELKSAPYPVLVEKCRGRLKTKLDLDRVVTYFTNKFLKDGVLEEIGQQLTTMENKNE